MKISKGVEEDMSSLTYERLPYVKFGIIRAKIDFIQMS